ncbi:hypothetical protein TB1_025544 [Malus domestica]
MEISSSSLPILPCNFHFLSAADPQYKLLQTHRSLTLLSKCKSIQSLKQVHTHITKTGLHNTHFALSKIIEFSAVSLFGDLSYAISVFESIENPSHVIWNTIIRDVASHEGKQIHGHFLKLGLCSDAIGLEMDNARFV